MVHRVLFERWRSGIRLPSRPLVARLVAILRQRCPACFGGPLFRSRWHLLDKCPTCGFHYDSPITGGRVSHVACGIGAAALAVGVFRALLGLLDTVLPQDAGTAGKVLASLGLCQLLIPSIHRYTRAIREHLRAASSR